MLRLSVTVVVCLAVTINANIVKRQSDASVTCGNCPWYNTIGRAFIRADDNEPESGLPDKKNCGHYIECVKDAGTVVTYDRNCAAGIMSDANDIEGGAPCSKQCDDAVCDCPAVIASRAEGNVGGDTCTYVQMADPAEFALAHASSEMVGSCGDGGYFDDGTCSCITMTVDCTCKVAIPLTDDINTHGCGGGWVAQAGSTAQVTIDNNIGVFTGWNSNHNNGPHLATYVIDGLFAGSWVNQVKITAAFKLDSGLAEGDTWGIVDYGDCAQGSSISLRVTMQSGLLTLQAMIELGNEDESIVTHTVEYTNDNQQQNFVVGQEYYTTMIYVEDAMPNSFLLYVMTKEEYLSCRRFPPGCPEAVAAANPQGTMTPRGCGFVVGALNNGETTSMFKGRIGSVSLDIKPNTNIKTNIFPCEVAQMTGK